MKAGFTLIELILAIFFSVIIMTVLFSSFTQINNTALLAEDLIEMDSRQQMFAHQFQKDISGAFVPVQGIVEEKKESKESSAAKKDTAAQKKEAAAVQPPQKKEEKPKKILENVFLSTNKGELLNELTFITNNPMRVYPYAQNTEIKPNMVRIVYRLQPNKEKKGSYTLMRQEGTPLDFAQYKNGSSTQAIKSYALIDDIKSLTLGFQSPQAPKEEPKKNEKKTDKKIIEQPIIFETKKEWHSNNLQKEKKQSQLPQFVNIKLTLWDNQQKHERIITLHYEIPAFGQDLISTKTQEPPKKGDQKEKDAKAQDAKSSAANQKIIAQRKRVLPDVKELKASIENFMNSRGQPS